MKSEYSVKVNMNVPLHHVFANSASGLKDASVDLSFHGAARAIHPGMYANLANIRSVSIPDGVKLIDDNAFANCVNLEKVTFEGVPPKIAKTAFANCPVKGVPPPRTTAVKKVKDKTK